LVAFLGVYVVSDDMSFVRNLCIGIGAVLSLAGMGIPIYMAYCASQQKCEQQKAHRRTSRGDA
jgi:hypothetical protein